MKLESSLDSLGLLAAEIRPIQKSDGNQDGRQNFSGARISAAIDRSEPGLSLEPPVQRRVSDETPCRVKVLTPLRVPRRVSNDGPLSAKHSSEFPVPIGQLVPEIPGFQKIQDGVRAVRSQLWMPISPAPDVVGRRK